MALPAPLTDALQSIQTMLATEGGLCSNARPPPRCDTPAMVVMPRLMNPPAAPRTFVPLHRLQFR